MWAVPTTWIEGRPILNPPTEMGKSMHQRDETPASVTASDSKPLAEPREAGDEGAGVGLASEQDETPEQEGGERRWWQRPIQGALQQAWSEARSAGQGLEEELRRRYRLAVERSGQGSDEVQRLFGELRERLQRSRDDLERRVQESVRGGLERVRKPLSEELEALQKRAEGLTKRVSALTNRAGGRTTDDLAADELADAALTEASAPDDDPPAL